MLTVCLGCQAVAQELPAVVTAPSAETQATLQAAVSSLLGGTTVRLAADAFANSSLLTLEHAPRQTLDGQVAGSLVRGKPEQFKLLITGSRCGLLRIKTGERMSLQQLQCQPEPAQTP